MQIKENCLKRMYERMKGKGIKTNRIMDVGYIEIMKHGEMVKKA